MSSLQERVRVNYETAKSQYAELGVDTEKALSRLGDIAISLQCWQGDDVQGFEQESCELDGGIAVTGNYLGRARNADQLRTDLEEAIRLIPGRQRLNLHAIYAETGGKSVPRNELGVAQFQSWIDWAKQRGVGLDFNPTYFSHPLSSDGLTLSHPKESIRRFWIDHGICCRKIGVAMGEAIGSPCVTNVWIPDGSKDTPVDRKGPRERLADSLDQIFAEELDPHHQLDSVESKLFGIGSESYVVGSHEFYLGYAIKNGTLLCIDSGHFHPTEMISDKISSVMNWVDQLLLHISRGVRWDSDHVVLLSDDVRAIAQELVRGNYLDRVHIGLDFFDATINRVAAWVLGTRSVSKALLLALLEPIDQLRAMEEAGDLTSRLALMEELRTLPFGAVWDMFCESHNTPTDRTWMQEIKQYEREVLLNR
ncbi:MAG: L-rhamnose isomerase [Planctomycetes bacterium]|nr:L-rhamnose isomerase [Planctomycetota bacterium]